VWSRGQTGKRGLQTLPFHAPSPRVCRIEGHVPLGASSHILCTWAAAPGLAAPVLAALGLAALGLAALSWLLLSYFC
jgi:hypothetical protein